MELIIELFSKVPNVMWSAITASFLTFLGVFLTNRGNENRQIALLEHEKQKYISEQKLALKKEVFLDVARSFADVLGIIPKLMNLDFTQKDIETRMADHSGIVAKCYLAAKESSVAAILNYSAETAEVFIKLMKKRAVVLDHKKAIETYQLAINSAKNEKDRIISIMKELNLQGHNTQVDFDYLNKRYDTQDVIVKRSTDSQEELESSLGTLHFEFSKECISNHSRLLSLLPAMTVALRGELENDQNSQVFIDALNNNIQRMNVAFESIFEDS
ncbi:MULTISPECIES: chromosome partitioning protein ParA [unclassified Colwellia]|uniref:chromosome partitioning protein ParA n=1 Tax=unclassified Colwellia TaxID=196834 RepID=UPI0015F6EB21|nr:MULTISPECIES: chromosome partitioning protein ParA [unclassified Colwellia]MBA6234060.1 chromosome partitioning protein ParA [Colwellia sp. MB02u-7]MBA6238018.1 chromosome partitioning protein ParA [Colwellia sp. MB02u-11]MBA6300734.1 chromosome partitioning protein ParA [Colwellia sp. MB3u-22]MBA6311367.1 chromosome partitioning protein ParA [Colwellia sp. MB3u-64]